MKPRLPSKGPAEQNQPYWAWYFAQGFLLTEWLQDAGQSGLCTAWWLIRCVKDRLRLLLVWLMRCHCPAGWAGPDRRRWRSTFPKLSLWDFAWLMDCDWTQLQGCLCRFFLFFFSHEASQCEVKKKRSVKHCWTRLMALNLHISRLGCTPGARSGERLKDLKSAGKRCSLHTQLLLFPYKKESDLSFTTYYEFVWKQRNLTVSWL